MTHSPDSDNRIRKEMDRAALKAISRLTTPDAISESWFWLSFADDDRQEGDQNLGCAVVAADDFGEAVATASLIGINPGGEVQGIQFDQTGIERLGPDKFKFMLNHLRSRAEMIEQDII